MIDGSLEGWWLGLERLFRCHANVEIAPMQRRWILDCRRDRANAYQKTCEWVNQDVRSRAAWLRPTFARYNINLGKITREVGMTVDQFRQLAKHPLVTVGGHTESHPNLVQLCRAEACGEIVRNKAYLETLGDRPVDHFAYPFGRPNSCGAREAGFVRQAGYRTATTAFHGCLAGSGRCDLFQLPRVGINRPYESVSLARLQIDGTTAAFRRLKAAFHAPE